jgi:hypothetical protein
MAEVAIGLAAIRKTPSGRTVAEGSLIQHSGISRTPQ